MTTLKQEFHKQISFGKKALKSNHFEVSFFHFENAHSLGQKHVYRHTLSHYWMFFWGLKTNNYKEIFGQILRILASLLFTLIWVPTGNTGGTNISPIKSIPIKKEFQNYFHT